MYIDMNFCMIYLWRRKHWFFLLFENYKENEKGDMDYCYKHIKLSLHPFANPW